MAKAIIYTIAYCYAQATHADALLLDSAILGVRCEEVETSQRAKFCSGSAKLPVRGWRLAGDSSRALNVTY